MATLKMSRPGEELRPRPVGLVLEVVGGELPAMHQVHGERVMAGRGPLCDIRLAHASISEFHFCLVLSSTEEIQLEDLGSSNGLWLGRARVQRATLLPGARFRAGAVQLRLRSITADHAAIALDDDFHGLRGRSEPMRRIFALMRRVAPTPMSVLVTGETGVGKGQLARAIHAASGRRGRLVTVDCTALPREMAEGLLLGHTKGAFTGAVADRPSPFEVADGGTIMLDEIGELPLDLQPKLLRVLDEGVVQRLGSCVPRPVDVRVIAATNRDLVQEMSHGRFRVDLYHRLAGVSVCVPPLRARREDVAFLAEVFLDELGQRLGERLHLSVEAEALVSRRDWPGNVRQLRQVLRRAAYLARGARIEASDLEPFESDHDEAAVEVAPRRDGRRRPLPELVAAFQREHCVALLRESATVSEAADVSGYSLRGFQALLKKLGVRARDHVGGDASARDRLELPGARLP